MKKRLTILTLALTAVTAFAIVAALSSGGRGYETQLGQLPAATAAEVETSRAAPTAESIALAPTAVSQEVTNSTEEASPRTGCGKPTPCPNRDCEDCPNNVYL